MSRRSTASQPVDPIDSEFDDEKDPEFRAWLEAVSRLCLQKFGLRLSDLQDMLTRDAFDNDVGPAEFFREEVLPMMAEEFGSLAVTDSADE
jgi:hypothetical protein